MQLFAIFRNISERMPSAMRHKPLSKFFWFSAKSVGIKDPKKRGIKKTPEDVDLPGFEVSLVNRDQLSLGELRRATGCFETVFLTFLATGVAGKHASDFKRLAIFASFKKGAGKAQADRFGLAGESTALDEGDDIIFVFGAKQSQRLFKVEDQGREGEIILHVSAVDDDAAFAGLQIDAGDRALTTASSVIFVFSHVLSPYLLRSSTLGC